jgi:mRNA-degrading endonuclease toxin of MazEF toxin-antitoxin module
MVRGEIYLANFPFGGTLGRKLRPALLLTGPQGSVPEFVAAYITAGVPPALLATDMLLDPSDPRFAGTHLKKPSCLRLHKLATIHQSDMVRHLGALQPQEMIDVADRLRQLLNL